ncbi:integrase, catalytic region, zinc finger, CCHC-type containing protein [Tanacetum coccineum]
MRQTKNLMDKKIGAIYNILKQNQVDVNEAMGIKKKGVVVVVSDPLALVVEKTKKPEYVKPVDKKEDGKKKDMSKVTCYNCKKDGHFAKDYKKAKVKDYNYYKTKMLLAKKDSDYQVLLVEDQVWMQMTDSDSEKELSANMVFMAKMEKVLFDSEESSSSDKDTSYYYDKSKLNYGLFVDNDDDQEIFHYAIELASESFNENLVASQNDHDESEIDNNESEEKDHLVDKLIVKLHKRLLNVKNVLRKQNNKAKI